MILFQQPGVVEVFAKEVIWSDLIPTENLTCRAAVV
jgi:hypothetical protein